MISIKNVTFQYEGNEIPALNSLSLEIPEGDFVGMIGTSGAGKTTLALALNGIVPHAFKGDFFGSITVDGMDTVDHMPEEFCRKVGEVFQDIDSQMVASVVEDEILFGMENFGIPHDEIGRRLDRVLKELGIEELRTREIASLSGGQKQKVAIASILALEPEIMVLDEPTGELDPESSREIFGLLRKLNREKGITIVIIEQKIMLLSEYVKHLVVLDKGIMKYNGAPREIIKDIRGLKELGINIPPVAELSGLLRTDGLYEGEIPLNVDEAQRMVKEVSVKNNADALTFRTVGLCRSTNRRNPAENVGFSSDAAQINLLRNEETMIRFEHAVFGYTPDRITIPDLSFHIPKGDFVALIGANGAGKSTISRLCNGLLRPTSGHVYVDDADTLTTPTSRLAKKVGFLFQNPDRQICENTVRDEIAFSMKVQGWPVDEIEKRVAEALETFSLKGEWFPFNRSRGERQRIALAGVLACEPDLLILDEPTTGLDYLECIHIMDYVTKLNQEKGITVLMVSHDMELVQSYARRVLVLSGGRLVGDGPVKEIMKQEPLLKSARVLPAQIPALALRFGTEYADVYTVEEMRDAICEKISSLEEKRGDIG